MTKEEVYRTKKQRGKGLGTKTRGYVGPWMQARTDGSAWSRPRERKSEESRARRASSTSEGSFSTENWGACHYLTNRFQMNAPVAPSRSLRGAGLREGFAEPPRRHHEPFAEVYEPFAEVAHTEGSTKTPWRVREASSKGPWMNCMFLLDHDCNRVWSIF